MPQRVDLDEGSGAAPPITTIITGSILAEMVRTVMRLHALRRTGAVDQATYALSYRLLTIS